MIERKRLLIKGQVQGVGFRPAVYKLACDLGLHGFVFNDTSGVTIELQGDDQTIAEFIDRLSAADKPPAAKIISCDVHDIEVTNDQFGFHIKQSDITGSPISQVTADMATCSECLAELVDKGDFRYRYPFINCTNCGPRYSIVKTIPYDRPNTTMDVFSMCDKCRTQYTDPMNRRFHAQPVACVECGPKIWLADKNGDVLTEESDKVIAKTAQMLKDGKIVAIKGIGGFHLAVDALNDQAVKRLRERKRRDCKPFAMMAVNIETIEQHAVVTSAARELLQSPEAPVVVLQKKSKSNIAQSVADGVGSFGFMLCYAPLHHLLFAEGLDVLVMTSGNISDEPLICDNDKALAKLGGIADAFLTHDRQIYRQVDDSVVQLINGATVPLRRSRGYVPAPVFSLESCNVDILACGADMKNTFCFVKGDQFIPSEHIGDLEDAEVYHHYVKSIEHLKGLFGVKPEVVVCDLHPGYFSTQFAKSIPDVKLLQVQHHWAHIASVLAEHKIAGPVIGIECDGTGYGTDGNVWGCECMIADYEGFTRFGHLAYYKLPGADKASKEAIRPLLGLLKYTYKERFNLDDFSWLLDKIEPDRTKQKIISQQIDKNLNTALTSNLGRVFDAVAAMVGIGFRNNFEAQLPMGLESIVEFSCEDAYDFDIAKPANEPIQLDLSKMIMQMIEDLHSSVEQSIIATKFHNCIAGSLLEFALEARKKTNINIVALSGGVFCNRYLAQRLIKLLNNNGFSVLFNQAVPSNDGGIALGQAAIAAHKMRKRKRKT